MRLHRSREELRRRRRSRSVRTWRGCASNGAEATWRSAPDFLAQKVHLRRIRQLHQARRKARGVAVWVCRSSARCCRNPLHSWVTVASVRLPRLQQPRQRSRFPSHSRLRWMCRSAPCCDRFLAGTQIGDRQLPRQQPRPPPSLPRRRRPRELRPRNRSRSLPRCHRVNRDEAPSEMPRTHPGRRTRHRCRCRRRPKLLRRTRPRTHAAPGSGRPPCTPPSVR